MKVKTSELSGNALDWAAAKCEGNSFAGDYPHLLASGFRPPRYSTDWSQGGPIIDLERISTEWSPLWGCWAADFRNAAFAFMGATPLIAAMRCYVASKLGDTIEVPDELFEV